MTEPVIYVEPDGPNVWLPCEHFTIGQARHEAASHAWETIGENGRARYVGRQTVRLHDCEDWEGGECEVCPEVSAWAFETYEGTWRT